MHAFRIAAALVLTAAVAAPAAAAPQPVARPHVPQMSTQAMYALQKAAAAMAGVTSLRGDLTLNGSPVVIHVTFTKVPLAMRLRTTVGPTQFSDAVAVDGILYQNLGSGTYGATRITNLADLVRTLIVMQMAMTPKKMPKYIPSSMPSFQPSAVTERDANEDGIAVARISMTVPLPKSAAATAKSIGLACSFAKISGLPHRCTVGFGGQQFAAVAFSGWNDAANAITAPAGVVTPPPYAMPGMSPAPSPAPTVLLTQPVAPIVLPIAPSPSPSP